MSSPPPKSSNQRTVNTDSDLWVGHISKKQLQALTDGLEVGEHSDDIEIRAPFTGELLGSVPAYRDEDLDPVVFKARKAQQNWSKTSFRKRKKILLNLHDLILGRQEEMLDLMQIESGKARQDALEEILDVAINCRYYAWHGPSILKTRRRKGALPLLTSTRVRHHPVGLVGLITPWNYPLTLAVSDAVPALMAGNAVILKPAEQTPFTALWAAQLFREAGLPEGLFQVITGKGPVTGAALIDRVDFIGFTGSTATGIKVAQHAGQKLIKSSMELGGKNPMIILDDADLETAINSALSGSFTNAGQLCISFERLFVQSGIYNAFIERFIQATEQVNLGTALNYDIDMGSLISEEQLNKVKQHVDDARQKGATILTGGKPRSDIGPYFYAPTIISEVTDDMALCCEETFGPVVSLHPFNTIDEAIQAANATKYGLNASVITKDKKRGIAIARQLHCGTVNINDAYAATWASIDAPMGGMKKSGMGRRHGPEGILKYTEAQTITVQKAFPIGPKSWLPPRSFARIFTRMLKLIKNLPGLR